MRTTLDIDDDVLEEAKRLARLHHQSLGKAVSDIVRQALAARPEPKTEIRNGIPVWVYPPGTEPLTSDMVRAILDEEFEGISEKAHDPAA